MSTFAQPASDGKSSRIEVSFPYMLSVGEGSNVRTWARVKQLIQPLTNSSHVS